MLLNRLEYSLVNSLVRAAIQRRAEAARLRRMGGTMNGGTALEIGCGAGVGVEVILDIFRADRVDAFDLDPRMVALARQRLDSRKARVRLWVGSAGAISAPDATYDAVFDFGVIHHVPRWRLVLTEVSRVLKAGGRFYAEEALARLINRPMMRRLFRHPQSDRFGSNDFSAGLREAGLALLASQVLWGSFAWFVATKAMENRR